MVNGECFRVNGARGIKRSLAKPSLTGNPDHEFALLHSFCKGVVLW